MPRHALDYHVVGSDAAGVVLQVGSAVRKWKPGDKVTVHCNYVDDQSPSAHDDSMLADNQRIWGFETNFGGLADLAVVKANQLMPKPTHLTWEEAAVNALCNSTSYRMLVSKNGAPMTQGDKVLVWGASGGLGAYAVQYVLNGGGDPGRRGVLAVQGGPAPRPRRRGGHRPQGGRLPVLEGRAHPGRVGVASAGQGHPGPGRRRRGHRVRAPGPPDHGGLGVRGQAGRHHRDLRGHLGLHDRVRQPAPVDEAQDHQGLPLRQLPGGVGRQPAGVRGQDPPAAVGRPPAGARGRGRLPGAPEPPRGQDRRAVPGRPRRAWASTTPSSGPRWARTGSPCSGGTGL